MISVTIQVSDLMELKGYGLAYYNPYYYWENGRIMVEIDVNEQQFNELWDCING